jgi:GT2 family glycosyltransferase
VAAVAVLTWRAAATTRTCLSSLRDTGGWAGPTVIVDNGSGTDEGLLLAEEFGVASVTLRENGGVPAGYNAAISWARANGATHVLLANNDLTFPSSGLVAHLMTQVGPDVAATGPIIRNADGSIASAGVRIRSWTGHARRTHAPSAAGSYEVDALDGSCMLVSVDAVCRIGGLAPEYFLYWEETDWCTRARAAGLRLLVDPGAVVVHVGRGSGDARQARRYALRNSLLYLRRNVRGLAALTSAFVWLFGRVPVFVVRRISERAEPRGIAADAAWAIRFHLRDVAQRGWRRPADGPELCD